jgi:hypothetical protein
MKRDKIVAQLLSELATANAASADETKGFTACEHPGFYSGYWEGRRFGLIQAITLLTGKPVYEVDEEVDSE